MVVGNMVDAAALRPVGDGHVRVGRARQQSLVAAMSRERLGIADQSRATTPTTCGPAIAVPLKKAYAESLPLTEERTFTPGATMSGLMRFEPSIVTGPGC